MVEAVVLIHGIWMTGLESALLRLQLRRAGFNTHSFSYRSVTGDLSHNAARLHEFIHNVPGDTVHIVAHSLGGLVALALLESGYGIGRPGNIVFLGSPVRGSAAARVLSELPLGEQLLGRSAPETLLRFEQRRWSGSHPIGTIAGTRSFGAGRLLFDLPEPNDGSVAVDETRLEGARDHVELPVTHTGMLFSPRVARNIVSFLGDGHFEHPH